MPHVPDTVPGKRVTDAGARTEGRGQPSNIRGGSRMQESCPYGSVRGAPSNGCPYRNRELGLRRGRRRAPPGQSNAPAARAKLERDQAAPGFGEEGEHCRRVIKRRATASKARPELGALLGLKAVRFGASNAVSLSSARVTRATLISSES